MQKKYSKFLVLIIVFCIVISLFGCSGRTADGGSTTTTTTKRVSSTTTGDVQPEIGYSLPLSTTGETLTIAGNENSGEKRYADGLPVYQEIEKLTGVKIEWESVAVDYWLVMQTRLAAGTALPDILSVYSDPVKYINDGLFIEIGELIDNYAPNIKYWFDKEETVKIAMTAPDRKIYTIPMMIAEDEGSSNDLYNTMAISIRKDWAKKLGFDKDPETLDELYELLKAYRDGDPNNTGKDDVVAWGGVGWSVGNPIGWAYGLRLQMDGGWALRDGKVEFDYINPRAKEWLQTINKWYNEGLIDRDFASLSWDSFSSRMLNSEVGTVVATSLSPPIAWNGNIIELTGDPEAGLYPILPVRGPYGHREAEARMAAVSPNQYLVFSKDIKNPELAIKWVDFAKFSEEGLLWTQFGVEGLTYDLVDGTPKIQDWVFESKDGSSLELFRVGALSYNLPQVLQVYARRESFMDYEYLFPLLEEIYNHRVIRFPTMLSASAEAEKLTSIMAEVNTYLEENITRFINGTQPLDKFDEFVNTLKQLGIDEAISIKQAQYDRTQ